MKTKLIDVDVEKIHKNINKNDTHTISDIIFDALTELGYETDKIEGWSWDLNVTVEVQNERNIK